MWLMLKHKVLRTKGMPDGLTPQDSFYNYTRVLPIVQTIFEVLHFFKKLNIFIHTTLKYLISMQTR